MIVMLRKLGLILLLMLGSGMLMAQNDWQEITQDELVKVYSEIGDFYFENDSYHVKFKYMSFKGHNSMTPHDQSIGYLKRQGKLVCNETLGVKTIQDEKVKVIIDMSNKMIGVYHPEKMYYSEVTPEMNKRSLTLGDKFFKKEVTGGVRYKVIFKESSKIEMAEFAITDEKFLKEMTTYFASELEWEDEKGEVKKSKAKLRIEYDLVSKGQLKENIEKTSHYVQVRGDKAVLLNKYKGFELNDFRVK